MKTQITLDGTAVQRLTLVLGLTPGWVHPVRAMIKVWCWFNCCQGFRKQQLWCKVYRRWQSPQSPLKAGTVFFTLSQLLTIRHSEDHHRIEGDWLPKKWCNQGVSDAFHPYVLPSFHSNPTCRRIEAFLYTTVTVTLACICRWWVNMMGMWTGCFSVATRCVQHFAERRLKTDPTSSDLLLRKICAEWSTIYAWNRVSLYRAYSLFVCDENTE